MAAAVSCLRGQPRVQAVLPTGSLATKLSQWGLVLPPCPGSLPVLAPYLSGRRHG